MQKPVVLVANKADTDTISQQTGEFFKLGYGRSSGSQQRTRNWARPSFLEAILEKLPPDTGRRTHDAHALKLAIVGRRNVGKSTFINSLAEAERVIVSEVPGTTRDSIDVRFERDGKAFVAIDTAGVRKKTSLASDIELQHAPPSGRSARRCGLVVLRCTTSHRPRRQAARRVRP